MRFDAGLLICAGGLLIAATVGAVVYREWGAVAAFLVMAAACLWGGIQAKN